MSTRITSAGVKGLIFQALEANAQMGWVGPLSVEAPSDSSTESYAWLGQVPTFREWLGARIAKQLNESSYTLTNKKYEATLRVALDDLFEDKTGQLVRRIGELATRSNSHWASLLTTLITNGQTNTCYDGQAFFSVTHSEGSSGTQLNLLTATQVASLNVGTATAPTAAEMSAAILETIGYMNCYKDDQGEPLNESAMNWIVMCGNPIIYGAALKGITSQLFANNTDNVLKNVPGLVVTPVMNSRLTAASWTTAFCVFRADAPVPPFIRQSQNGITVQALAEGSDFEFENDAHLYGLKAKRAAGYGMWQAAAHCTLL